MGNAQGVWTGAAFERAKSNAHVPKPNACPNYTCVKQAAPGNVRRVSSGRGLFPGAAYQSALRTSAFVPADHGRRLGTFKSGSPQRGEETAERQTLPLHRTRSEAGDDLFLGKQIKRDSWQHRQADEG